MSKRGRGEYEFESEGCDRGVIIDKDCGGNGGGLLGAGAGGFLGGVITGVAGKALFDNCGGRNGGNCGRCNQCCGDHGHHGHHDHGYRDCSENTPVTRYELGLTKEVGEGKAEIAAYKAKEYSDNKNEKLQDRMYDHVEKVAGRLERQLDKQGEKLCRLSDDAIRTDERLNCLKNDLVSHCAQNAAEFHATRKYAEHLVHDEHAYGLCHYIESPKVEICCGSARFKGCGGEEAER